MPWPFARPAGPARSFVDGLRRSGLRGAKLMFRGPRGAGRLILAIGQMHPVLRGRFEGFQARRIADTQAWIFGACVALTGAGVHAFGEEGLSLEGGGLLRLNEETVRRWKPMLESPSQARRFLRDAARRWVKGLRRGDRVMAQEGHDALNALSALQVVDARAAVFPIEQRSVHGAVGAQIAALHGEIARLEASGAYIAARRKGNRGLTREEYDAVLRRNAAVRAYNRILVHPERDRSIFREVLRHAETDPRTVYVLGQAHRGAQLRLAAANLPPDTLFCWATPPVFWRWAAVTRWAGMALLLAAALAGYWLQA